MRAFAIELRVRFAASDAPRRRTRAVAARFSSNVALGPRAVAAAVTARLNGTQSGGGRATGFAGEAAGRAFGAGLTDVTLEKLARATDVMCGLAAARRTPARLGIMRKNGVTAGGRAGPPRAEG